MAAVASGCGGIRIPTIGYQNLVRIPTIPVGYQKLVRIPTLGDQNTNHWATYGFIAVLG